MNRLKNRLFSAATVFGLVTALPFTVSHFAILLFGTALTILGGATSQAQLTFTFSDNGMGNTRVTGSGSEMLSGPASPFDFSGFLLADAEFYTSFPGENGTATSGLLPPSYIRSVFPANPFGALGSAPFASSTLALSDFPADFIDFGYVDTTGNNQQFSISRNLTIPIGTLLSLSGFGDFALPFSYFADTGLLGTTGTGFTGGFIFVFGDQVTAVAPAGTAATVSGGSSRAPTVLVANTGAITSAQTTGLSSMASTLGSVQNAAQNAVGDLNNRIFNARSGGSGTGRGVVSSDSGTSRYLTFAQNQNIDYRVALGLADGEEVEIVDTLSAGGGHPFAMVGVPAVTGAVIVSDYASDAKNPSDKVVIEDAPDTRFAAYTSFDYGFYDQDNLSRTYRGFESDSYAGSAGLEYKVAPWLNLGGAFTYLESDTRSTANLGTNDLDGEVYSLYATAFHGNTYLDVLYSYGDFDNDISRNTLLGRTAYGDTESHSHNIAAELGHTIQVNERFSFGPSAGLNYTTGEVDGYTERNGGLANLIYPDHDFESMIGRLGGYATFKCDTALGLLTNQFSAGWAHEFQPENGNVTASLETSPFALVTGNSARSIGGFTASEERAHAGTDWLELGATTRLDIGNTGFNFQLGYQGMFGRNNASGHFGSAKIGYEW